MSMIRLKSSVISNDINENENSEADIMHLSEEQVMKKRNKSLLRFGDRNMLHNEVPLPNSSVEYHNSVKYKRRMYGLYGDKSGVDPGICWPTSDDIMSFKEHESLSRPHTLKEMVSINSERKAAEKKRVLEREEELLKKLAKLEKWKEEFDARIKKREADAAAAKAKKDRLIEEVRRHFGFKVDPRDDRFKEMLEKKEREEKKLAKEAKRKAREAKLLSQLVEASGKSDVQKPT